MELHSRTSKLIRGTLRLLLGLYARSGAPRVITQHDVLGNYIGLVFIDRMCTIRVHNQLRCNSLNSVRGDVATFACRRKRTLYQMSFNPNCTCRDVVEVLLIAPAVPETPEGVNTIRLGVLKLARFRRLKISARNCRVRRS
jgi:hypothetical protein